MNALANDLQFYQVDPKQTDQLSPTLANSEVEFQVNGNVDTRLE